MTEEPLESRRIRNLAIFGPPGAPIQGSVLFRDFCRRCGDPVRVSLNTALGTTLCGACGTRGTKGFGHEGEVTGGV